LPAGSLQGKDACAPNCLETLMAETADSRAAILEAAKLLFMREGFRGISMRQIAEAVGVTKAALYYHFQDKEELFVAIVEQYLVAMSHLIDEVADSNQGTRAQISELVRRILAQPPEQRSIIRLASQELSNVSPENRARFLEMYHGRFINRITGLLAAGMASGELRQMNAGVATWALLGMMYPYFHPSPPSQALPIKALVDELLAIYFDGIAPPAYLVS
jgi:AcrR family transcriptional regulator